MTNKSAPIGWLPLSGEQRGLVVQKFGPEIVLNGSRGDSCTVRNHHPVTATLAENVSLQDEAPQDRCLEQ